VSEFARANGHQSSLAGSVGTNQYLFGSTAAAAAPFGVFIRPPRVARAMRSQKKILKACVDSGVEALLWHLSFPWSRSRDLAQLAGSVVDRCTIRIANRLCNHAPVMGGRS